MKNILVPYDFSPESIEAFKFALSLASVTKTKINVLHIIEFPAYFVGSFDTPIKSYNPVLLHEFDSIATDNFEKIKKKYTKKSDKVNFLIIHGSIILSIREYIKAKKVDLVVMGTKGATGLKEFFIGSNTEKIVRSSKAPVFVVQKAPKLSSLKDIILPVTLDSDHKIMLKKVRELQLFFKAKLHLLFVNHPNWFQPDRDTIVALEKIAKINNLKNYTLNIRSDYNEANGIGHFAEEKQSGLIAIATHGRKGIAHLLSGSVAEEVVNHFDFPIWTFIIK